MSYRPYSRVFPPGLFVHDSTSPKDFAKDPRWPQLYFFTTVESRDHVYLTLCGQDAESHGLYDIRLDRVRLLEYSDHSSDLLESSPEEHRWVLRPHDDLVGFCRRAAGHLQRDARSEYRLNHPAAMLHVLRPDMYCSDIPLPSELEHSKVRRHCLGIHGTACRFGSCWH